MTNEIKICMGSSCFARGNNENLEIIETFIKENNLEAKMYIDYIRIYQTGNSHEELHIPPTK